jgi:hypothetical protein
VQEKIGVLFVVHGGMSENRDQYLWDAGLQQFSFDPNHSVYKLAIWNPAQWGLVMQVESSVKFQRKYLFEYPRLGDWDPFHDITDQQFEDLKTELNQMGEEEGLTFEYDWAAWMCGECPANYPYPRFIYYGPDGLPDPEGDYPDVTYCGEDEPGGSWADCDSERYNVDGPAERLLKKGVSRIIMVDMTVGGMRFGKTYDVVKMTKRVIDDWNEENGTDIPYPLWVNDYTNLMERSFPSLPEDWTRSVGLEWDHDENPATEEVPITDRSISLDGSPNPIAEDPLLATLQVESIEAAFSPDVSDAETGVILLNHALHDNNEVFDPKIDDTLIVNENIKTQLLDNHPDMDPENIIGAFMGIKEENPENGLVERTRGMRGEALGYAWLYQSDKELPPDEWGYRYWDALEYLKNRGVKHIAIGFPQIVSDSVLNLVEFPNQIGKEIGYKSWAQWETKDLTTYPGVGHPFTDYWGNWVDTECDGGSCCFTMGGCGVPGDYPPARQADLDKKRDDMDPSLAYEVSEYGHLGYDPDLGSPDPDGPVQDQYTGTWEMYRPPNDHPDIAKLMANHVLKAALGEYDAD